MKKVVVMLSSYHPYFSAVGKCMRNIILEIEKDFEVIVISNMKTIGLPAEGAFGNHKIIRVRPGQLKARDRLEERMASSKNIFARSIFEIGVQLLRLGAAFQIIFSRNSLQKDLSREYTAALKLIGDIDIILPTCSPFESIVAAQRYNDSVQKKAKIIPILFDKFSGSPTLHRLKLNQRLKFKTHLRLEERMIQETSRVFFTDSWKDHMETYFSRYADKTQYTEHPLIIDKVDRALIPDMDNQEIDIVYAGVLDKKIRPPQKTLEALSRLADMDHSLRFHFYSIGNAGRILEKYRKRFPANLFNHGYIESDLVLKRMAESDVLLSIGNTDISYIPSKIFEYMSIGKPIIHFYASGEDRIIEILDRYQLAICVKQVGIWDNKELSDLLTFIREIRGKKINFSDVKKIFLTATPKYVADQIRQSIQNL